MNAWLLYQQCRFMRPDAGRYLRPDMARFLALERKWDGQPRMGAGGPDGGQYTYGLQYGGTSYDGDRPRVELISTPSDAELDDDEPDAGDLRNSIVPVGMGHNRGPALEEPPEIPRNRPSNSVDRTAFARAAAQWIGAALGAGAAIPVAIFLGALNNIEWLQQYNSAIESYRDPPRTLKELQDGVGQGRPGYDDHHIIEQTAAQKWGLTRSEINDKSNVVSIPRLKHYQITGWYQKANPQFGGLSPRQYLSDKGLEERRAVGLRALELYKVLKR